MNKQIKMKQLPATNFLVKKQKQNKTKNPKRKTKWKEN